MAGLDWHGDRVLAVIEAAAAQGVSDGIDLIAETAKTRVLVQTGELRRSQRTEKHGLQAVTGFTDSKAVGAHENLAVNVHQNRNPQAQAKFLESAAADRRGDVRDTIADHIRRAL
jgi:hypothetical protein